MAVGKGANISIKNLRQGMHSFDPVLKIAIKENLIIYHHLSGKVWIIYSLCLF